MVGELFALDEVFGADFGLVHAQFLRQHVDHALHQVHRLGHAEGAAVGHATGRFVGVDAVDLAIGVGDVVAAGADMEHTGREFGRVGAGVKRAVVGNHIGAQCEDLAVSGGGQFTGHVVVAGKAGGGQILDPVFHPLDRAAQHDGGHDGADIAGVNRHFVTEAAADVGRDDAHLGLRNAREHGHHGTHNVRRLAGEVGGEFAADRIERGHRAAGLQRAGVHARVVHVLRDRHSRTGKHRVGSGFVAGFPGEDVVVVVALTVRAFGFTGQVFTQHWRAGFERLKWVDHGFEFFVFDFDGFHAVGGAVAVFGNHDCHFLHLKMDFFVGENGLHITGQRGHPVQLERLQIISGQNSDHAGDLERGFFVDALDARMRHRGAHDVHMHHAGQFDVVDVIALALDKAGVFFAQAGFAHAHQGFFAVTQGCVHEVLLWVARLGGNCLLLERGGRMQHGFNDVLVAGATAQIAGHADPHFGFGRVGVVLQEAVGAHQHARCAKAALQAVLFVKAVLQRVQHAAVGQAFDGFDFAALALHGEVGAGFHRLAVNVHGAGAAVAGFAADVGTGEVHFFTQKVNQQGARLDGFFNGLAIDLQGYDFFAHGVMLRFRFGLFFRRSARQRRGWRAWSFRRPWRSCIPRHRAGLRPGHKSSARPMRPG